MNPAAGTQCWTGAGDQHVAAAHHRRAGSWARRLRASRGAEVRPSTGAEPRAWSVVRKGAFLGGHESVLGVRRLENDASRSLENDASRSRNVASQGDRSLLAHTFCFVRKSAAPAEKQSRQHDEGSSKKMTLHLTESSSCGTGQVNREGMRVSNDQTGRPAFRLQRGHGGYDPRS